MYYTKLINNAHLKPVDICSKKLTEKSLNSFQTCTKLVVNKPKSYDIHFLGSLLLVLNKLAVFFSFYLISIFEFLSIWLVCAEFYKKYVRIFTDHISMLANQFSNSSHLRPIKFSGGTTAQFDTFLSAHPSIPCI